MVARTPAGRSPKNRTAWTAAVALVGAFAVWCGCRAAACAAEPRADADSGAVKALRAGLDKWERSVEFRCSFSYRETFAARIEDALKGNVDDSLGPELGVLDIDGKIFKKRDMVRVRLDYGESPKLIGTIPRNNLPPMRGPLYSYTNVSYDECSNGEVDAAYCFPHGKRDLNELYFRKLEPHAPQTQLRPSLGGHCAEGQLSPLNPLCNARGRPLQPWDYGDVVQSDTATVEVISPQRRQVHLRRVSSHGTQERWVTVWVEPELPVVERILEKINDATGKETHHMEIVMRKFVPCPGGQVPTEIVHATRNPTSGRINVRLWSSDDLGAPPVKNEDFIIETAPHALVLGLARRPAGAAGKRQFDMNKITLKDVEDFKKLDAVVPFPPGWLPFPGRFGK